jgi:hypothetical protein
MSVQEVVRDKRGFGRGWKAREDWRSGVSRSAGIWRRSGMAIMSGDSGDRQMLEPQYTRCGALARKPARLAVRFSLELGIHTRPCMPDGQLRGMVSSRAPAGLDNYQDKDTGDSVAARVI